MNNDSLKVPLPTAMAVIGLAVATAYHLWGVSALMVVALDHLVIRRARRLPGPA
jgi:hypothetical protein